MIVLVLQPDQAVSVRNTCRGRRATKRGTGGCERDLFDGKSAQNTQFRSTWHSWHCASRAPLSGSPPARLVSDQGMSHDPVASDSTIYIHDTFL